jgi:predicted phosphate transport protein (TIGR00153 family)
MWLRRLLPKDVGFFDFFEQHAALGVGVCRELLALVSQGGDIQAKAQRIKELEHQADDITHRCVESLHKTFITPFDRAEIHNLINRLDDMIDSIDTAANRMVLYQIREMRPEVKAMAEVLLALAEDIAEALKLMRNFKNAPQIDEKCAHIHHLENEGDNILRQALVRLFNEETNAVLVIKWKEIYERLEKATDRCESVANIIQGIVIEAT